MSAESSEDGKKDAGGEFESEMVDPIGEDREPGEKCRKCERSGWRSRHASFCSECQTEETEKLRKKCEKCSRKGFAFRNIDFCETMCREGSLEKSEETTTAASTEEPFKETVTEEMTTERETTEEGRETSTTMTTTVEEEEEKKGRRGGEVRAQNRCKRCQRKGFYRRNAAFCDDTCHTITEDDEGDGKEPARPRNDDKKKVKESKEKLKNKLGPLEDLIKYLIQKNHGT